MPVSAISQVERIGYELVRTDDLPKDTGKPATMRDYAKMEFEPWEDDEKHEGSSIK